MEHVLLSIRQVHEKRSIGGESIMNCGEARAWRTDKPSDDREVLTCGHAGCLVAYWSEANWWESWTGDKLDRPNVEPWAWQELPEKCKNHNTNEDKREGDG